MISAHLKAGNNWTYKFTGLPVTDSDGNPVQYTVVQSAVTNYITTGGSVTGNASDGFEATFKHLCYNRFYRYSSVC